MCELKFSGNVDLDISYSHTLTGVWVEIVTRLSSALQPVSHPHGCVSWNIAAYIDKLFNGVTPSRVCELKFSNPHTLDAEICVTPSRVCELKFRGLDNDGWDSVVTPSRVCELKLKIFGSISPLSMSHPHGCVSWNSHMMLNWRKNAGHTLTGMYWKLWQFPDRWFAPITPKIQR